MGKDTELLHAVKVGDVSAIRKFLFKFKSGPKGKKSISKKLNINHPDEDGFTVLHHAALLNNVEVILALIEMEADPNSRDKKGMCPLHMASWAGKDQVVKALLDNRALVNLPSFGGETPLLLASQHGYANVVEILMKYNADPTIRNNNLESPLDLACQFGHAAVARFLLMRGEVVHMLREKHTDPRYKQPLHLAAKGGHVDVIRLLTESGADINEQSPQGTCLHLAALYGKVEVLKFLIEAGANVRAVNKKDMTPLDMVNQFTTSRAGIEIKQILREALGERVVFARANSDYVNVYDPTGLSFKTGETITVLEQNEDGRWKGSIVDGQEERVGYFPAKSVSLLSNVKETRSLGSLSSSSDSSINSTASGRDIQGASKSQGRKMTDSNKPVGVVPVGTYEVLTLAPTQSPESKKPPNIPRLNSFKKEAKAAPPRRRKTYSQEEVSEEGASSNRSSSIDTSSDSGMHSHSTGVIQESTYDIMTGSPRPLESNFYDPIPSPTVKSPRIFPTNAPPPFEAELREKQAQQHNGIVKPGNYADIDLSRSDIKPPIDSPPKDRGHTISYTEVYVADNETTTSSGNGPLYQSEARLIPQGTNKKMEFRESYENMNLTEELISKFGRTPEGRSSRNSATKSQEYEDMRAQSISPSSEPFPSPPALPLKSPPPAIQPLPEELPPSPPKKIESRFMPRRPECYENVQPRQIIPIHTQNPFEKNSIPPQQEPPFPTIPPPSYNPKTLPAYPEYENYRAPGPAMPLYRSNTYENYRPVNEPPQPQITRSQTVSERPVSSNRPVPLPPKMNRKSVQDSSAPASPCPADSVKTPFLSQLDMDSLNEDEKELLSWLIELKLPQYFQNFQAQGFDMVSVRGVTPEDLTEIEITKAGHRKKLLSEITKLGPSNKLPTHKPEDIGAWLSLVGLRIYEENFVEGGFDEMDFIKDLDQSDLQMIEIKKKGHQKKLLLAVQRLSDVELTAELDRVVEVTALPTTSTATQEPKQDLSTTQSNDVRAPDPPQKASKQPPPDAIHRNEVQSQPEQLPSEFPPPLPPQFPPQPHQQHPPQFNPQHPPQNIQQAPPVPPLQPPVPPKPRVSQPIPQSFPQPPLFPPPPPSSELESHFLCNRDNLPPPSGKESTPLEPIAPTPPRAPIRVTADINQASNSSQPSIRPRTTSVPVAPKPKPKPRPGQNMGQVRTASEYHATDSPSKAVIMPAPVTPQKPTVPPKGDENESVTAARSRDFWQQGHQQQQQPPTTSATNTPVRTKSISGIKPIVSPRPSQKPTAPQTQRPVNQNAEPSVQPGHEISSQRISHSRSVKKVPPPAPPRRDSMPHKKDVPAPQPSQNNDVNAMERSRTFSGPLDEKIRDVFRSKGGTHTLEQAPIIEQTQEEFPQPPPSVKAKADEDFEATDMIMADIDDMIADFTNQLDSMF